MGWIETYAEVNSPGNNGMNSAQGESLMDNAPDSNITVDDVFNFENASAKEISDKAQKDADWAKSNASLIDYWLNEKSYYGREDTKIARYMDQLKNAGINPILAYQYAGNASASGGAQSNMSDYVASLNSAEASKRNANLSASANIIRGLMILAGVGLSIIFKNPIPILASTMTTFGDGWSKTDRTYY